MKSKFSVSSTITAVWINILTIAARSQRTLGVNGSLNHPILKNINNFRDHFIDLANCKRRDEQVAHCEVNGAYSLGAYSKIARFNS